MPNSHPQVDAFPAAYNVALHAARDLTLAPDERARVIDLFVQVLLIWPKRWNECIEREVAELVLLCAHEAKTAEELVGVLQSHTGPATVRILVTLLRRAYEGGHLPTLLVVLDLATHLFASEPKLEDRWIEAAIVQGLRTPKEWRGGQIAVAWLEARPQCAWWLREQLRRHPTATYAAEAEPELFMLAPTVRGALAWAEQAVEGYPVSFERAEELSGDERALFDVLAAAVRRAKTDAVRTQLETWLTEVEDQMLRTALG